MVSYCFYRIVCVSLFPLLLHMHSIPRKSFNLRQLGDKWCEDLAEDHLNISYTQSLS